MEKLYYKGYGIKRCEIVSRPAYGKQGMIGMSFENLDVAKKWIDAQDGDRRREHSLYGDCATCIFL